MKRAQLSALALVCLLCCHAQSTVYRLMLAKNAFQNEVFPFRIVKVIDGRIHPHRPAGFHGTFVYDQHPILADSLDIRMTAYFRQHASSFDAADPVILVINQLKYTDYKLLTLSVDFYRIRHDSCLLVYKQYLQQRYDILFSDDNFVNGAFSNGISTCLKAFRNQPGCESFKEAYPDTAAFFRSFSGPQTPQANMANIKDGLYFSVKELYLNRPGLTADYTLKAAPEAGQQRIHIQSKLHDLYAVYAVVKNGRIFITTSPELYAEAAISPFGSLYFVNAYKPAFDKQGINTKQPLDKTGIDFETGGWIFPFY